MLGGKNKESQFSAGGTTLLAKSVEITGDIKFGGTLEVEGRVKGNVFAAADSDAQVNVRDKGFVEGEIRAPKIMINGQVTGDVYSDKHLELAAKAVVNGNVHYRVIEMVKGAQVNGSLVHIPEGEVPVAAAKTAAKATPQVAPTPIKADSASNT